MSKKSQALFRNLTRLSYALLAGTLLVWLGGEIQLAYLLGLLSVVMMMASSIVKFSQNLLGVSSEVFSDKEATQVAEEGCKEDTGSATAPR